MDAEQIDNEWKAALADAGFTSAACALFVSDLTPKTGRGAQWWAPNEDIEAKPDDDLVTDELAREANSSQNIDHHRVVVRRPLASDPVSVAMLAGKLRHELEHARQWDACGPGVFLLAERADWALARKVKGLPLGNVFTNLKPTEQDANAASAMFLRQRHPDSINPLLLDPEVGPMARSLTPPGSFETLAKRMVAFLYLYEDLCAALEETWAIGFAEHLDEIQHGAGALWRRLQAPLNQSD